MLDEVEYAELWAVYEACRRAMYRAREGGHATPRDAPVTGLYRPVQDAYARMTGVVGVEPQHMLTHRLAAFGPPCTYCGRPLRTPTATSCVACGRPRAGRVGTL